MRHIALTLLVVFTACAGGEPSGLGSAHQAIVGGSPDVNTFPSVCVMKVQAPPAMDGQPPPPVFYCSAVVVEDKILLTSALCVQPNVEKKKLGDIDLRCAASFDAGTTLPIKEIELYRYWAKDSAGPDQLALIQLDGSSGVTPAVLNLDDLTGQTGDVTLVGFGARESDNLIGTRYSVTVPLLGVADLTLSAGTTDATTCRGDSGGAVFMDLGAGPVLVGMTGAQNTCDPNVNRTRIDRFAADFIIPYIDRFSGNCPQDNTCTTTGCRTPDPDCGDGCAWNGKCVEDCPTRDWDCPLGKFVSEPCTKNGECEEYGTCIAAADDATFTYCTKPCDPAATQPPCPDGMECTDAGGGKGQCTFTVPSPGSQGFPCEDGNICRSGICEGKVCVDPCTPGGAACPSPFICAASSVQPGTNVCLDPSTVGGGGFCAVGGGQAGASWLLLGLALGAVGLRRRRG